ncbi:MAG: membrane protein insertion efficiency factor YidD [Planctomycetota bacterium]
MPARCLIGVVRLYQRTLSPLIGQQCRFQPTCSNYAIESLRAHGAWRGTRLTIRRLLRCHPWGGSGFDPPPETRNDA